MRPNLLSVMATIAAPLFVVVVLQPDQAVIIAAIAAVAVAALLGARHLAVGVAVRALGIGHRSRQHRNVIDTIPTPQHPHTAGRRRARAPSALAAVA